MTRFLLDTTVLISHLRGDDPVANALLALHQRGHSLCISCVNVAEVERGLRATERRAAGMLLDRLELLVTTKDSSERAGRYQANWAKKGRTIHLADALVAGTARTYGAVLLTDNIADFPMRDIRVVKPEDAKEFA